MYVSTAKSTAAMAATTTAPTATIPAAPTGLPAARTALFPTATNDVTSTTKAEAMEGMADHAARHEHPDGA